MDRRIHRNCWFIACLGAIVGFYALAPELHRIARTRTEDYLQARIKSSVEFADFHVSVYPRIHLVINTRLDDKGPARSARE